MRGDGESPKQRIPKRTEKEIVMSDTEKTTDLGEGFFWNQHKDGSATLRNMDKGVRLDVSADSVERLRAIFKAAEQ